MLEKKTFASTHWI